ncbi:amino acid ABC transporter permease [Gymnodinialimonas ceratoperidinii]|uniref:Amino acid ABC transporter permease n=1 Tax=Gymnodinialimonas ceratoperidinii TaxID=2856823 RepID=A0A8F6YB19_9RHOB|nr:amino acid ABC transporter permease [Gymnodinialimonas ceratoperidinii]QXT39621.1 amino acid ABC transporter permease [Gymnodinialimonas ceratoperidinii]
MSELHSETALDSAYVRTEMLPEQAPPITAAGPVRWVRDNLFSSIANAIMTILSLYVIYVVLAAILPWVVYGIWDAGSLSECREIREARYGPLDGHGGGVACWAVLVDRWDQLMFGFYPPELYWRPILAFLLFLGGIAPVLYDKLPRKMLILTAAMPFICFWLLWGGSIWAPVLVAAGFGIGWAIIKFGTRFVGAMTATILAFIVPILFWVLLVGPLIDAFHSVAPIGIESVQSREFGGFLLAFVIGASGIILSMPLGIVLALGRQSDLFIINKFSVIFIEVIRGVPLIVWLFTAQLLLGYFLPPGSNFDLMVRVIIMVTLFSSAYIAEVIRGGLAALPRGQYEGADSLGLNYWQSMQLIILPQALKISIPGIVSSFIGLFKDTTLVVFIGLFDPIGFSNAIRADTDWNGIYWELFIFIGLCFFICCFSMSRYSQYLERKLATGHR